MIIETSCNHYYRVRETEAPGLGHVWLGVEVKRVNGQWVDKTATKPELVRKDATKIVVRS